MQVPIVLDLGVLLVKCGFAGESLPRRVFPNTCDSRGDWTGVLTCQKGGFPSDFDTLEWDPLYTLDSGSQLTTKLLFKRLESVVSVIFDTYDTLKTL